MSRLGPWELESVSAAAMAGMAEIFADPNPIHLSGEAARQAGLGDRPVNQGPANCGYIVNMLLEAFPDDQITSVSFRLRANVFAGDRVVAGGEVREADDETVRCEVWLDVVDGPRAVEGSAVISRLS